jgi:hypothetical protein
MISKTTRSFRERFASLPPEIQQQARAAYNRFRQDPTHPSLHFKLVQRRGLTLHSARVGLHYRALAYEDGGSLYWFWIGPHAEYDHLLDRMSDTPALKGGACV